ncbi:unnamed protein product [Pieris brassicae]|uniref:Uncharacterized protein n=1 Tax=Pieris brassicae TaxID=7116 RepID=A0A9P0TQ18_PIEBR|nr:unnamed protein product [Pieris brassicae]
MSLSFNQTTTQIMAMSRIGLEVTGFIWTKNLAQMRPQPKPPLFAEKNVTIYKHGWILVHEGECSHDIDTYFKPLHTSPGPLYRLSLYFTKLVSNYQSAGLENPLRQGVSLPKQTISGDVNLPLTLDIGIQPNPEIFPSNNRGTLRPTLPHKVKQYIDNFVKDMFLGNSSESIN